MSAGNPRAPRTPPPTILQTGKLRHALPKVSKAGLCLRAPGSQACTQLTSTTSSRSPPPLFPCAAYSPQQRAAGFVGCGSHRSSCWRWGKNFPLQKKVGSGPKPQLGGDRLPPPQFSGAPTSPSTKRLARSRPEGPPPSHPSPEMPTGGKVEELLSSGGSVEHPLQSRDVQSGVGRAVRASATHAAVHTPASLHTKPQPLLAAPTRAARYTPSKPPPRSDRRHACARSHQCHVNRIRSYTRGHRYRTKRTGRPAKPHSPTCTDRCTQCTNCADTTIQTRNRAHAHRRGHSALATQTPSTKVSHTRTSSPLLHMHTHTNHAHTPQHGRQNRNPSCARPNICRHVIPHTPWHRHKPTTARSCEQMCCAWPGDVCSCPHLQACT
ncbi:uncharacterized protein LOC112549827 [Alligator sinensis]|uniref:Uncharacterized protein LOC112549827 n=1 Tax=Alligator sinensis TaxID=38654 RepID=A0A3Q0GAJ1_ALLSI|nr:uncharacterized protein LOC112549827 [Alligator sinensis]